MPPPDVEKIRLSNRDHSFGHGLRHEPFWLDHSAKRQSLPLPGLQKAIMRPNDAEIWKRVVERQRQESAHLSASVVQRLVRELDLRGFESDSFSERIEIALNAHYAIATDTDRSPEARREAFDMILKIRRKLQQATNDTSGQSQSESSAVAARPIHAQTTGTSTRQVPAFASAPSTKPTASKPSAGSSASSSTSKSQSTTKPPPTLTIASSNQKKKAAEVAGKSHGKTSNTNVNQKTHHHQHHLTASLAAAAASTAEEAALAAPEVFPSQKKPAPSVDASRQAPRPVEGVAPPPYQRTSTTVAETMAKKAAKQKTGSHSSSSTIRNGVHHPPPPTLAAAAAVASTTAVSTGATTNNKRSLDSPSDDMEISDDDDDHNTKPSSTDPKSVFQPPPSKIAKTATTQKVAPPRILPSSMTLDTKTTTRNSQTSVDFPMDGKTDAKGCCHISSAQKERYPVRAYFRTQYPSDEMLKGAGRLFEMWEPYWQVEQVVQVGVTSPIDRLVWAPIEEWKRPQKSPMTPSTAASFDLPSNVIRGRAFDKLWGVAKRDPQRFLKPNEGDLALLLRMLPIKIDPKYKNKRARCHLWPMGTFLMVDGVPISLHQRKQASHDLTKWEYQCQPVDLAAHIKFTSNNQNTRIAMCCHDKTQYFFMVALCSYKSSSTLTKRLLEPSNNSLERLSLEQSIEKAMNYINQQSVVIDDTNADPSSATSEVGKLVFSLIDPIGKQPMKIPVRGQRCRHFQVCKTNQDKGRRILATETTQLILNRPTIYSASTWRILCSSMHLWPVAGGVALVAKLSFPIRNFNYVV